MKDESPFDQAWGQWRRDLTASLRVDADRGNAPVARVLSEVDAFDPEDGLVRQQWALGVMTEDDAHIRPLAERGLSDRQLRALIACIRRHPLPAAGG